MKNAQHHGDDLWNTNNSVRCLFPAQGVRKDTSSPLPAEMDADAAAGGSRCGVDFDTDASSVCWKRSVRLELPIESKGSSSVASAGLAQLQKTVSDSTSLQARANAAIERLSRQQSALRRIPVACPSCGTLNVPGGNTWGVGELVPCQECYKSFVPMSTGLQDSDLAVLRSAVQQLRSQAERIHYLEQLVARGKNEPTQGSSSSSSSMLQSVHAPQKHSRSSSSKLPHRSASSVNTRAASPATAKSLPRARSPISEQRRGSGSSSTKVASNVQSGYIGGPRLEGGAERGNSATPSNPSSPGSGSLLLHNNQDLFGRSSSSGCLTPCRPQAEVQNNARQTVPPLKLPLPQHAEAFLPPRMSAAASTPQAPHHQARLLSLMDTQDLITQSSTSSAAPYLHGSKLSRGVMDTEQVAREAVQHVRDHIPTASKLRLRSEREEGEIASASESEASICSRDLRYLRPQNRQHFRSGALDSDASLSPQKSRQPVPPPRPFDHSPFSQKASRRERGADLQHGEKGKEIRRTTEAISSAALTSSVPSRFLGNLAILFLLVFAMKSSLGKVATAADVGETTAPALLTAILAGSSMALWSLAQDQVETHRMFDTSQDGAPNGVVSITPIRAWRAATLELSLEEAFGIASALAHLAPVCLFESWGLHGPSDYRWAAVAGHTISAVVLTLAAHHHLHQMFAASNKHESGTAANTQVKEMWIGLAAGNWVASSWASASWWKIACASAGGSPGPWQVRLPVLSLAITQLANFWLAQKTRQHGLLSACAALAGLSMACCSSTGIAQQNSNDASVLLTPGIYMAFCAVSAFVVFRELFLSL